MSDNERRITPRSSAFAPHPTPATGDDKAPDSESATHANELARHRDPSTRTPGSTSEGALDAAARVSVKWTRPSELAMNLGSAMTRKGAEWHMAMHDVLRTQLRDGVHHVARGARKLTAVPAPGRRAPGRPSHEAPGL